MKYFKIFTVLGLTLSMGVLLTACSDDEKQPVADTSGDHVWKTQTDALQSAKDVTKKMQESIKQQQENMDKNN